MDLGHSVGFFVCLLDYNVLYCIVLADGREVFKSHLMMFDLGNNNYIPISFLAVLNTFSLLFLTIFSAVTARVVMVLIIYVE